MRRLHTIVAVTAVALGLLGTGTGRAETLRVFSAASLTDGFREVAGAFEKAHPGVSVELNFAGSQVLRTQIEQGAPADVFAPADREHGDVLVRAGLLAPYEVFARNKLVVVVPAADGKVRGLQELAKPGTKLVVAGATVPAGRYTLQVLTKLATAGLFGDDFQSRAQANIVSQETNVRVVLSKVALGEADAGFVYGTDAATSEKVRAIDIPERHNVIAEYTIGVLRKSAASGKARTFVDFVLGAEGQAILRKYGFAR